MAHVRYHPLILLIALLYVKTCSSYKHDACPCTNVSWCNPTKSVPEKEVVTFWGDVAGDAWKEYDWSVVTTLGVYGPVSSDIMCFVHSVGARVVAAVGFPKEQLTNATFRHQWIDEVAFNVTVQYLDGVNLDIEGSHSNKEELTQLTVDLGAKLKFLNPYAQISFDTIGNPFSNNTGYDWVGLANATDFFFVMMYDLCWGSPVATGTSPMNLIISGLQDYAKVGVTSSKLVLGLPWYGYDYTCKENDTLTQVCTKRDSPYQLRYDAIQKVIPISTTGVRWDDELKTMWLNYVAADGTVHQVWFDNPISLSPKYQFARAKKLIGVGVWGASSQGKPCDAQPMWDAIVHSFLS